MFETILQVLAIIAMALLLGAGPLALIALSNRKNYEARPVEKTLSAEGRVVKDAPLSDS